MGDTRDVHYAGTFNFDVTAGRRCFRPGLLTVVTPVYTVKCNRFVITLEDMLPGVSLSQLKLGDC